MQLWGAANGRYSSQLLARRGPVGTSQVQRHQWLACSPQIPRLYPEAFWNIHSNLKHRKQNGERLPSSRVLQLPFVWSSSNESVVRTRPARSRGASPIYLRFLGRSGESREASAICDQASDFICSGFFCARLSPFKRSHVGYRCDPRPRLYPSRGTLGCRALVSVFALNRLGQRDGRGL